MTLLFEKRTPRVAYNIAVINGISMFAFTNDIEALLDLDFDLGLDLDLDSINSALYRAKQSEGHSVEQGR